LSFIEVAPGSVSGASYNRGAKSLVSGVRCHVQIAPDLVFGEAAKFRERRILYLAPATSRFAAISSNRQEIYSPQRVGFIERNLRKNIHLARFTLTELQFKDLPIPKRSIQ